MKFRIVEVSNHQPSGSLYVMAEFWLDSQDVNAEPPYQTQDFILDIRAAYPRIQRDSRDRWVLEDGTTITQDDYLKLTDREKAALKFRRGALSNDPAKEALRHIQRYWDRQLKNGPRRGNLTSRRARRNSDDPRGILTAARTLEGSEVVT